MNSVDYLAPNIYFSTLMFAISSILFHLAMKFHFICCFFHSNLLLLKKGTCLRLVAFTVKSLDTIGTIFSPEAEWN